MIFAEFAIEKGIVESGASGIGGAAAVIDGIEARPVGRGQAHGAGFATGVEFAAGECECAQRLAGGADGVDLAVSRGVVGRGDGVRALADDLAFAHNESAKGTAFAGHHVLGGEGDGAAQKLRIGLMRHLSLLLSSLNGESKHSMAQAFRSTRVLTPQGLAPATLVVEDGRISSVREWSDVPPDAALHDVGGMVILPGLVDTHVHINETGRTEWEGFWTATRAAAAGGVTTLVDMPLNCVPETIDVKALEVKRAAARGKTWVDWATWGGVVRGNAAELKPMAEAGVPGFKCFLIHSGIDGFAWVDEAELRLALEQLRGIGRDGRCWCTRRWRGRLMAPP